MQSPTTMVQMAVKAYSIGEEFTARDIANTIGIDAGAVGHILSRGVIGTELAGIRKSKYRYSNGSTTHRGVRVYRRISTCPIL